MLTSVISPYGNASPSTVKTPTARVATPVSTPSASPLRTSTSSDVGATSTRTAETSTHPAPSCASTPSPTSSASSKLSPGKTNALPKPSPPTYSAMDLPANSLPLTTSQSRPYSKRPLPKSTPSAPLSSKSPGSSSEVRAEVERSLRVGCKKGTRAGPGVGGLDPRPASCLRRRPFGA